MATTFDLSGTSPSTVTTVASTSGTHCGAVHSGVILATLQGGTGGTLDVYLQHSPDGTNWYDYLHFPQLAAGAAAISYSYPLSQDGQVSTPVVIGTGTSPALAANAVVGGKLLPWFRVVYKTGASTTAGTAQTIKVIAGD